MKKLSLDRLWFGCILLFLASGAALPAAPKIGVLLKGRTSFWSEIEAGVKEAAAKAGLEVIIKIPVTEDNVAQQIQLLRVLAAQEIQVLVIAPIEQNALKEPVAALAAKGVKIVVLDSPLAGNGWNVFVGTDQNAAGAAAGRLWASLVQDKDEVALFRASETHSGGATEQRENNALAAFRESRPNAVVYSDFISGGEPNAALERAGLLLAKHPQIKAVFASASTGTFAMIRAVDQKKLAGSIKLVGFGFNLNQEAADALEKGTLHGWIAQLPRDAGSKAVEAANALLQGGSVPRTIHTDFLVITRDNLKEPKAQALLAR